MIVRKTLSFTKKQDQWIKSQIENGDFTNESEYIRHLIRQDQVRVNKFLELKDPIQKGIESGESQSSVKDIIEKVKSKISSDGENYTFK